MDVLTTGCARLTMRPSKMPNSPPFASAASGCAASTVARPTAAADTDADEASTGSSTAVVVVRSWSGSPNGVDSGAPRAALDSGVGESSDESANGTNIIMGAIGASSSCCLKCEVLFWPLLTVVVDGGRLGIHTNNQSVV